jgi:hypothetical protein
LRSATLTIQREVRPMMEASFGGLVRLRAIAGTVHSSRFGQRAGLTRLDPRLQQLTLRRAIIAMVGVFRDGV